MIQHDLTHVCKCKMYHVIFCATDKNDVLNDSSLMFIFDKIRK